MSNVGGGPPPPDLEFVGLLMHGDKRQVLAIIANALILLDHDPALIGLLAFDELYGRGVVTRSPPTKDKKAPPAAGPYPRPWLDQDVQLIVAYLQRVWTSAFSRQTVEGALIAVAMDHRYHPIRGYLDGLVWDDVKRLDIWLQATFDTPDTPYARAVGAKWLIAAVRRVRQPGCKFDHMIIFEGLQGLGKSQTIALLFGVEHFTDSLPHDLSSRDAVMALQGIWAAEFPEIDQIIRADVETVKAFLSRGKDRYRVPYGRGFIEVKRQCVLCGTSNSRDYLRDQTGNRRFWPIECRTIDPSWIALNRDQLWAEAVMREAAGEALWLDEEPLAKEAVEMQASRMTEDTWEEVIKFYLTGHSSVTTAEVLWMALNVPRERQDRKAILRVCQCLRTLGWQQKVEKADGEAKRLWRPRA